MRFTKQLTACLATIGTLFFASAALSDDCDNTIRQRQAEAKANRDFWDGLMPNRAADGLGLELFGEQQTKIEEINGRSCEDVEIKAEEFPFKSYSTILDYGNRRARIMNSVQHGELQKDYIVGVTQDGATMTIHCNPGNCTVGSLNRFSVLTGAPMMVPAALLDKARYEIGREKLDDSGVWKTVASVIWSEPKRKITEITKTLDDEIKVNYELEIDKNAIRAKKIYEKSPEAYKSKQEAFKKSLNTGDKFVLNTKGVVSTDFSADVEVVADGDEVVVTETVVTCTSQGQTDCVDAHDQ